MNRSEVMTLLKEQLSSLPRQERQAATVILERPHDVAVMSMRELARLVEVPPSTMTRLAKRIGLLGYDELREAFIESVRSKTAFYGGRAEGLIELNRRIGGRALVQDMANNAIKHIQALCTEENVDAIVRSARLLRDARQVYSLGLRSSYAVAFEFAHVASYFSHNVKLVEGSGESGVMSVVNRAGKQDVALVCSMPRYSSRVVKLTEFLHSQGVSIIAITDSPASPIARVASETILAGNAAPSFFDTVVPAMLVSELLIALLSATAKANAQEAVSQSEQQLLALGEWWDLG